MLRITTKEEAATTRLVLEGSLRGPWVGELEKSFQVLRVASPRKQILVDLTNVMYVDEAGKRLLRSIYDSGAELYPGGAMIGAIVRKITGSNRKCEASA